MIFNLTNGLSTEKRWDSPTMGLHLNSVTLKGLDLYQLLQMSNEEMRERLGILYTRFAPLPQEQSDDEN